MEPEVLYIDSHLLVLNKPHGLLTQPTDRELSSLETWGKDYLKEKFNKPGNVFLEALFRLDRSASGIVVFARTSKAIGRLQESLREGKIKKSYLAWVEGHLQKNQDLLKDYLIHDSFRAIEGNPKDPRSKEAALSYRVLKEKEDQSLLDIDLLTGRYHQIRFQFSKRGCPILGDRKYGSRCNFSRDAIALLHYRFQIPHPISQETLLFELSLSRSGL